MRMLNRAGARDLLRAQGVQPEAEIDKVLGGFDLNRPLYEHDFWPDDVLFQLVRLPSSRDPLPNSGNWFGPAGMTTRGVAVNDGISGRRMVRFKVVAPFKAMEGTAARFTVDLSRALGGDGGATQIFVPTRLLGHVHSLGPAERR